MSQTAPTQAELDEQDRQRQQLAQSQSSGGGIMDAIMGFLKFLFEIFFPGTQSPGEDAGAPPESAADRVRMGKLILDKKAIPNWEAFQQAHAGQKVNFINPVVGGFRAITRDMGEHPHPGSGETKMHTGVDLKAQVQGTSPDIVASADGIVLFAGTKSGYGNTVIIGHADGSYSLYGHLRDTPSSDMIGSTVNQGAKIGVMGQSGDAEGIHLHYEQRKGTDVLTPKLVEVGALVNGVSFSGQEPASVLAMLADPSKHPKLAVGSGTPQALAFAAGSSVSGARRG